MFIHVKKKKKKNTHSLRSITPKHDKTGQNHQELN